VPASNRLPIEQENISMSVSLQSTDPADLEVESFGHDYRLSDDQFRRAVAAGIIPEADGVTRS
jgi:hypothetical protein